jgi:apolipoprotein N-acyltransferase
VAVVQSNVAQSNKTGWAVEDRLSAFGRLVGLTREAAGGEPDVIVWPETMFPGMAMDPEAVSRERAAGLSWRTERGRVPTTYFHDELMALQGELGVPMIVGAIGLEGLEFEEVGGGVAPRFEREYNSAFLIEDGGVRGVRYDKMELTPFGEVMPYISAWPWLERRLMAIGARGMSFELSRGRSAVRFEIPSASGPVRVATPICFEATETSQCRELVGRGGERLAGVLINLTNDGWFGGFDAARVQHLLAARWRCLELRTPMVRAANTGISAAIGADGLLLRSEAGPLRLGARTEGVLMADVPVGGGVVPGGLAGRVLGWLGAASLLVPVGAWLWARTRRREGSKNELKGGSA